MKDMNLDGQEATEEDIILAGMGFNLAKIEGYKKRYTLTSVIDPNPKFKNKYPLDDVLYWYLKVVDANELKVLKENKSKFRKPQQEQIEKAEVLFLKEEPQDNNIQGYIEKNANLIEEAHELAEQNNELFKKISELQDERDSLKELSKHLIKIFIDQKIKAELTIEEIELIKKVNV